MACHAGIGKPDGGRVRSAGGPGPHSSGAARRRASEDQAGSFGLVLYCVPPGPADGQCQSLMRRSSGAGEPAPVSASWTRLRRNVAHFVLQWFMNSTGSRQPACLNMTIV